MGLFTFGKKKKPSKSVAPVTKSALPISTTAKIANETNVLEVAVANDPVLPLTTKADTQNISLMEDILGELSVQSNGENKWKPLDDLQNDVSLSLQLARALELDNAVASANTNVVGTAASNLTNKPSSTSGHGRLTGVFGSDSIYGSGSSLTTNTKADSWINDYNNITAALYSTAPATTEPPLQRQPTPSADKRKVPIVLDSDVSDSEEDEDSDVSDDEYRNNHKVPGRPSHLKLQNKYKQKTPAETQQEMIDKMKERHRAEARIATMRSKSLRVQQHSLSSSSRYHSLQTIPTPSNFINANPMTTLPINYPLPTHRLPNVQSMQELSSCIDDREPIAYPHSGRAGPLAYTNPSPHQSFSRGHLGTSPSYPEQMVRSPHASRENISEVSPVSHVQYHHKKRFNNEVRLSHHSEKSMPRENVLRKSKSFSNEPHGRRRYVDSDLPPMPASPTSEPGFDSIRSDNHSHVKLSPTSNRVSSNNSSITDESDTPNLPLTPSDLYDESPQRGKSPLSPALGAKPHNVVKHTKSESSLRRTQQVCPEEDQDEHIQALKEDNELKWHYRCYRQQNLYTSFSDYLAATQYQKMMLQHQQHIIYNPYPVPGYQYH